MLIIEIKGNDSIDRALKTLKSKVIKTKQQQKLLDRKEYVKKSQRFPLFGEQESRIVEKFLT